MVWVFVVLGCVLFYWLSCCGVWLCSILLFELFFDNNSHTQDLHKMTLNRNHLKPNCTICQQHLLNLCMTAQDGHEQKTYTTCRGGICTIVQEHLADRCVTSLAGDKQRICAITCAFCRLRHDCPIASCRSLCNLICWRSTTLCICRLRHDCPIASRISLCDLFRKR